MSKKKSTSWDFKRFFEPMSENPLLLLKSSIAYGVWALDGVFSIIFIKEIVHAVEMGDMHNFYHRSIAFGVAIILYFIARYAIRNRSWVSTLWKGKEYIHQKYVNDFLKLDGNSIEKYGTGKLIAIIDKWMHQWAFMLDVFIQNVLGIVITLWVSFYLIAEIGLSYLLVFLGVLIVCHLIVIKLNTYTIRERRNQTEAMNNYSSYLTKIIMSKAEMFQNKKRKQEVDKLTWYIDDIIVSNRKRSKIAFAMFEVPWFVINLFRLLVVVIIGYGILLMRPGYSYGQLAGIITAFAALYTMMDVSITFFKDFTKNFSVVEKLRDFFDNTPAVLWYNEGKPFVYKKWDIVLHNVSFNYNDINTIPSLSLEIVGSKKTAFVGVSGSGKSTLIKLIAWYLHAHSGYITIDGQQLPTKNNLKKSISLKTYYDYVGYLTQEPNVFDGTIYENLIYALDHQPSEEKIDYAIQQAQCQFIYDFANGLDTEIWEKWIRLSWGQRQRLAIAKIFLKDPKIVLLDEPTSALDSLSEEAITKAMHNLFEWRTVIIIAHRLQTVKHADDIIVIEAWKVIERGTHKELVSQGGHYAKMLELQSWF